MVKRIAINGFGRIGRTAFRILHERHKKGEKNISVYAINDLAQPDMLAHLLKYDSIWGPFQGDVQIENGLLVVDGEPIYISHEHTVENLPWRLYEIDVALESTGALSQRDQAELHLAAGAKKVLVSAPVLRENPDATICYGVNHNVFNPQMKIISAASCTTNCIAPVAQVLDQHFGIKKASITTIHSYTNDQKILDAPGKDKRRCRAGALSIIPTMTGAAKSISLVLPELEGKVDGMAIRVPTPNVSCIDVVALLAQDATSLQINEKLRQAAIGPLKGILGYTSDLIVSADLRGRSESAIVDSACTNVIGGNFAKILAWYDNEWGFSNRAVDLLALLAQAC